MKISASIYSDAARPLQAVIADLVAHQVDLLHIDCNDDLRVFDDIKKIREWCTLPLDLHIITPDPSKFYPYLLENPVEYLTFQVEDLTTELQIPAAIVLTQCACKSDRILAGEWPWDQSMRGQI